MKPMNADLKKVMERFKDAQGQLQNLLKDKTWVEDARKYAERQGKEVKKLLTADVAKVRVFLDRERKELERFQKQIPGEVKKFRKFVDGQKKEFEKLLKSVKKAGANGKGKTKAKSTKKKSTGAKKTSKKASAASASAQA